MFLRARTRHKDGKQHRYWSVVESRRVRGGHVLQRHLLHLGELNDSQRADWVRTIDTLTNGPEPSRQLALFPDDRDTLPELNCQAVRVRVDRMQLRRPRQFCLGPNSPCVCFEPALDNTAGRKPRSAPGRILTLQTAF